MSKRVLLISVFFSGAFLGANERDYMGAVNSH